MLYATWKGGSLRFWIGVGMAAAVLPLLVSAVAYHVIVVRSIVADFEDVASRQRDHLLPAQRLQVGLWEAADQLDLFLVSGDRAYAAEYRRRREAIAAEFARLHEALVAEPDARTLVERARADWRSADTVATQIFASPATGPEARAAAPRFDGAIAGAVDRLAAAYGQLARRLDDDHTDAGRLAERADWIAAVAALVSLVSIAAGVTLIGYLLTTSVERLVEGAARFAAGDRDYRIDISVPPELHRVAEEFNHMIVQIRQSEAALTDLARRDRLTGLLNRRALDELLAEAFARHERTNDPLAVVMLDLDLFKGINDHYGHAAGDEVLRLTAARIDAAARETDKVCRYGGEEFVVLLPEADRAAAATVAERIRNAVGDRPLTVHGREIPVTISAGVATTADSGNIEGLLAAADRALYQAKAAGRNRVICAGEVS